MPQLPTRLPDAPKSAGHLGGRGRHDHEERDLILGLVDEATAGGARQDLACEALGVQARTMQRWRGIGIGDDQRAGPLTTPGNKLTAEEQRRVLDVVNSPDYRDLSPKQIVPALADAGRYLASESTIYRLLRERRMLEHRGRAKPPRSTRPDELVATAANQVWSWDITYLQSPIRGQFLFLYLITDIFSRKVVGHAVHASESAEHAADLIAVACAAERVLRGQLVIHSDNGSPMKGATMLATLQKLGVVPSFSRPHVSDDNPYSEALFRTLKYRPEYPSGCFASIEAARQWVDLFVAWYNNTHFHSGIGFVAPSVRHSGDDAGVLAKRRVLYEAARIHNPARWSRHVHSWTRVGPVSLNPRDERPTVAVA